MGNFANPFNGKNIDRVLTQDELIRALREMISAELEATNLYQQLANNISDKHAQAVLRSIANEELVHVGEFSELLKNLSKDDEKYFSKGLEEAKNIQTTTNIKKILSLK